MRYSCFKYTSIFYVLVYIYSSAGYIFIFCTFSSSDSHKMIAFVFQNIYSLVFLRTFFTYLHFITLYLSKYYNILRTSFQSLDFVALLLSSFACDSSSFGLELELFVDATLTDKCCFPVNLISLVK